MILKVRGRRVRASTRHRSIPGPRIAVAADDADVAAETTHHARRGARRLQGMGMACFFDEPTSIFVAVQRGSMNRTGARPRIGASRADYSGIYRFCSIWRPIDTAAPLGENRNGAWPRILRRADRQAPSNFDNTHETPSRSAMAGGRVTYDRFCYCSLRISPRSNLANSHL